MFENYDFRPGVVTYNPYKLSPNDISDIEWLNEDMLQVVYPMGYILDVGWYGKSYTLNGIFVICIIKDSRWDEPIMKEEYRSLTELYDGIKIAVKRINHIMKHRQEGTSLEEGSNFI